MTAKTLLQLYTPFTVDECKTRILNRLAAKGIPTTDWSSGSIARTIVEIEAQENSDYSARHVKIANLYLLSQSFGDQLDIVAKEFYGLERYPATFSKHIVYMLNNTGESISIVAGQLTFATNSGLRFSNFEDQTITTGVGEYVGISVIAEQAGILYNSDVITTCLTPIVGLDIDSEEISDAGTDIESDNALSARCLLSLSSYSLGMSNDSYSYWSRNGHAYAAYITKTKVKTDVAGNGIVSVYLGGSNGAISDSGMISFIQTFMRTKAGSAITLNVYSAQSVPVNIYATITTKAGYSSSYVSAANAAIQSLISSLEIGQGLTKAQIIEALMSPPGTINCVLSTPSSDITVSDTQVCSYVAPVFGTILTTA